MQVSKEDVSVAAGQENGLMQQATLEHLNKRVVELRVLNNELIKLLEKNGVDWEAELEKPKQAPRTPQDRKPGRAPAKKAASSSRGRRT